MGFALALEFGTVELWTDEARAASPSRGRWKVVADWEE
jgi:hypothetical protein